MSLVWERTASRRKWWKLVLLAIAGCVCLLVAGGFHSARQRRMAEQNEDSSVGWDSVSLWHQTSWSGLLSGRRKQTSYRSMGIAAQDAQEAGGAEDASRKMVRTAALEIEVKDPAAVMEQIRALAGRMDGYLVNSQIIGGPAVPAGRITIRVPTLRMEEAIGEIRKL